MRYLYSRNHDISNTDISKYPLTSKNIVDCICFWHTAFVYMYIAMVHLAYVLNKYLCTTIHRYPIFSTRYFVMCKVYTGYCGTSEIEHGLCAYTVENPLAKARRLSLRTGAQTRKHLILMITAVVIIHFV